MASPRRSRRRRNFTAGIAAGVAREQKVASPMLQLTAELFRAAHVALGEEADHVEVVKWVERLTGTVIE